MGLDNLIPVEPAPSEWKKKRGFLENPLFRENMPQKQLLNFIELKKIILNLKKILERQNNSLQLFLHPKPAYTQYFQNRPGFRPIRPIGRYIRFTA